MGADYERYELIVSKLEDTISLPPASIDMVFPAVMMHFTDPSEAMAAVAHQLKPGGTFLAAGFAYPVLEDEAARDAWLRMFQRAWRYRCTDRTRHSVDFENRAYLSVQALMMPFQHPKNTSSLGRCGSG